MKTTRRFVRLLPVCAALLPVIASAADDAGAWYVSPDIGGVSVDHRRGTVDKDWLYGVRIGKNMSERFSLEADLNGAEVRARTADTLTMYSGSLNLLTVFGRQNAFAPYATIGLGVSDNQLKAAADHRYAMTEAGVGALARAWESGDGTRRLFLRPELKVRWSDAGGIGTYRDYIATIGVQMSFGAPATPVPVVVAVQPEPPAAPPIARALPPPPDTDGDGVLDAADKCPDTPHGVAVDLLGCPRQGSVTLEGVNFETASDRLTADSRSVLDRLVADLKAHPRLRIELQGHTDSVGSDAFNLKLSQRRADSVRNFLTDSGIQATRLVTRGYGESQPVASNETADGRLKNRRVVMYVLDNPADVKIERTDTTP